MCVGSQAIAIEPPAEALIWGDTQVLPGLATGPDLNDDLEAELDKLLSAPEIPVSGLNKFKLRLP